MGCGELLVQYMLLKHGIESAGLTTDPSIDLIAFLDVKAPSEGRRRSVTIQVKTSTHFGSAGDKWLLWQIPENCPADYIAVVDLYRNKCWLIRTEEFKQKARRAGKGQLRLWWPLPECEYEKAVRKEEQFKEYEMDVSIPKVFEIEFSP